MSRRAALGVPLQGQLRSGAAHSAPSRFLTRAKAFLLVGPVQAAGCRGTYVMGAKARRPGVPALGAEACGVHSAPAAAGASPPRSVCGVSGDGPVLAHRGKNLQVEGCASARPPFPFLVSDRLPFPRRPREAVVRAGRRLGRGAAGCAPSPAETRERGWRRRSAAPAALSSSPPPRHNAGAGRRALRGRADPSATHGGLGSPRRGARGAGRRGSGLGAQGAGARAGRGPPPSARGRCSGRGRPF